MNLRLKFKILERFGNQGDFGQAVNADEAKVSRVIHNRRTLRSDERVAWAKALGCDPDEIFGEQE